ncbi:unnamed protein product [Clonostachys chloroleuca]|uniref:Carrier domain-containing protein n=1 Tax=Clonostachys chloroleuca TaxID=1926264 RepID=A0AA35M5E7_9HYPO|nr:unnamed protein product [Clonostachys chloroleuca]
MEQSAVDQTPVNGVYLDKGANTTSQFVLNIFFEYALNKFDDSQERMAEGAAKFLSVIDKFILSGKTIEACLPAFPFKSANKVYKVLGSLPDKAEELALERLNTICKRVREIYPPGAKITIISDGITYNDLLSISDRETWAYGEALREMAVEKGFTYIEFARMKHLLDFPIPDEELREITYVANCTNFRRLLINTYGKDDLDIDQEIANNPDTRLTYLGYRRFLESDLKYIFPPTKDRTKNGYRRDVKFLAKQMLMRGYAFAGAIQVAFPNHLRLSIHESFGASKVSISLLNTKTGFTTPWHCSVALLANGEWVSAPMSEFKREPRLELVYENDRPSYFKEKPASEDGLTIADLSASFLRVPKRKSGEYSGFSSGVSDTSMQSGRSSPVNGSATSVGSGSDISSKISKKSKRSSLRSSKNSNDFLPYGKRLVPQIMDGLADTEPLRTVFSLATLSGKSIQLRYISAREFTNAVNKTAWWIHNQVGKPDSIQPIGYIGPHDLRHVLLTHACSKAGYATLFLSPKNTLEGTLAVLEATSCSIWVKPGELATIPLVKDVLERRPMKILELPLLDDLLDADSTPPFPFTKTFEEAVNEPFCFLHTSGSTGHPKPIPWSHGLIGTMDAIQILPPTEGDDGLLPWTADWKKGDRIYSSFPMSHGAGVIMDILLPALLNLHCVLGPVGVLPNMNLIESLAEQAKINIWSMVPSLVDELGETPDVLTKFKSSKFICASGGPVSPISAGKVNEVIRVLNLTGTTEGLFIGNLVVPREDWWWFSFHPYSGFEFKEVEPGTYEHWVHRNEHWPLFQGIFHTFPDKDSINLKDLYKRHPTKPNLWAFKGRSDDLVVLSNGYKISPLETEAFISTHPAIDGCLVIGTGRPQAALLIELKDPSSKTDEKLLDSIWETVQKANSQSRHKNQLLRDFITFAEADKPFIRTDKRTVKRPATLALYADFIERFYSSRNDDLPATAMDTSSVESIQRSFRSVLEHTLPGIQDAPADADLFELGLDSLGVFAAVKTIRAATGLKDKFSTRYIYSNPTISTVSNVIHRLVEEMEAEKQSSAVSKNAVSANLNSLITQHKARQSFRLNSLDYVNPNHYMGLMFYFPLREGVSYEQAFENLQEGLNRTLELIPALGGKMMNYSEQEFGYNNKGDLGVTIPPLSKAASVRNRLVYKDLSDVLPAFEKMREDGFVPSAHRDDQVLPDDPFPKFPANILVAQANFVKGGCILAVDMNHCCLDGMGVMIALKAWAENCRYLQGDHSATCDWYDPESFNHSLPEIIHEQEGWSRPVEEIDPGTWGYLPFFPPEGTLESYSPKPDSLPRPPVFPLHSVWPLPRAERVTKTTLFKISPENVQKLKDEVLADPEAKGVITSISDIVQAFLWRSAIRVRYRVAKEQNGRTFSPDEMSILELPTDGRPYFSSLLPETYMGSLLILNRSSMPIETLCAPETTIGQIAYLLRTAAARITPSLIHDAFTILQSLTDHSRFSTANMGVDHFHAMISNMILFQTSEVNFGDKFFGNNGSPEQMRPQLERGNGRFRFLIIPPMLKDGGVELLFGTYPEELEILKADEEFVKYAEFVDA